MFNNIQDYNIITKMTNHCDNCEKEIDGFNYRSISKHQTRYDFTAYCFCLKCAENEGLL